ncbi:hypothetical protein IV487_12240 [Enterococcus saccharolyticus]|uniref:V-type ATPase, subunit F family protein n=1 Tax=Candidatus Enterococcus willemsii TaxID=1857215 RepID=A0ABQ6Z2P9_9ENTE|nr:MULTISPECIES: DUF342 domain-containing protein [Enterococcus]KAF1306016.1 hypothetical protein BAU17_03360 [Enterococcus sp. CU12B]MCD5003233.1 hypothetical protein [Enterococcus saccharolyticus]
MKEALEKVRQAEQANLDKNQQMLADIAQYKQEKEEKLTRLRQEQQTQRNQMMTNLQQKYQESLQQQQAELAKELSLEKQEFERMYQKNKVAVLEQIIEGVKQANGSE